MDFPELRGFSFLSYLVSVEAKVWLRYNLTRSVLSLETILSLSFFCFFQRRSVSFRESISIISSFPSKIMTKLKRRIQKTLIMGLIHRNTKFCPQKKTHLQAGPWADRYKWGEWGPYKWSYKWVCPGLFHPTYRIYRSYFTPFRSGSGPPCKKKCTFEALYNISGSSINISNGCLKSGI